MANSNNGACLLNCRIAACGDGHVRTGLEECDLGAMNSNSGACLTTCKDATCGDGHVRAGVEACDDLNLACGTCNSTCTAFASARATGSIRVIAPNSIIDGETFTLDDGINPPVTFEFMKDGTPNDASHITINIAAANNTADVRNLVRDAIDDAELNTPPRPLLIDAATSGNNPVVALTHDRFTVLGNRPILHTVASVNFEVTDMAGGAGGDCDADEVCATNEDCESNDCAEPAPMMPKVCQAPPP
jgi:hypothetical protein